MKRDRRVLVIKGKPEIAKLEGFIEEICDYYNVGSEHFGNVMLATSEAAVILFDIHNSTGSEPVEVGFDREARGMVFTLKLGAGYETIIENEDILDREIRRHKLSRDIFVIRALADEISISPHAESIVVVFYVSGINYEKSLGRMNHLKAYWSKNKVVVHRK